MSEDWRTAQALFSSAFTLRYVAASRAVSSQRRDAVTQRQSVRLLSSDGVFSTLPYAQSQQGKDGEKDARDFQRTR